VVSYIFAVIIPPPPTTVSEAGFSIERRVRTYVCMCVCACVCKQESKQASKLVLLA